MDTTSVPSENGNPDDVTPTSRRKRSDAGKPRGPRPRIPAGSGATSAADLADMTDAQLIALRAGALASADAAAVEIRRRVDALSAALPG